MSEMELFSKLALYFKDGDKVLISGVTANGTVFKDQFVSLVNNPYCPKDVDNFRNANLLTNINQSSKNVTAFFNDSNKKSLRIIGNIDGFPYTISMCASPNLDEYFNAWSNNFQMGILITQMETLNGQVLYESSIDINDKTVIERIQKKKMKAVLSLYDYTNIDINNEDNRASFAADVAMVKRYMQIMQDKPFAKVEYVFNNKSRDDVHMDFYKKERENNSIAILYADDYIGFDPYYNRQANMADSLLVNGEEVMKPSLEKSKLIESFKKSGSSTDELMHLFDYYFEDKQKVNTFAKK